MNTETINNNGNQTSSSNWRNKTSKKLKSELAEAKTVGIWNTCVKFFDAVSIKDKEGFYTTAINFINLNFFATKYFLELCNIGVTAAVYLSLWAHSFKAILLPLKIFQTAVGYLFIGTSGLQAGLSMKLNASFNRNHHCPDLDKLSHSGSTIQKLTLASSYLKARDRLKVKIEALLKRPPKKAKKLEKRAEPLLKPVQEKLCLHQLRKLRDTFLVVNPKHTKEIEAYVRKHYAHHSSIERKEKCESLKKAYCLSEFDALTRRTNELYAKKVKKNVPKLIHDLKSHNTFLREKALKKACDLFDRLKAQADKGIIVQSVGIISSIVAVSSLILALFTAPGIILFVVSSLSVILAVAFYAMSQGYLESDGWKFQPHLLIPQPFWKLGERIYNKIYSS